MRRVTFFSAVVLVCAMAGSCRQLSQTAASDCDGEPMGTMFAAIEDAPSTEVMKITGVVESVTPADGGYHDRIVVISGDDRYTLLFSAAGKQLPVVESLEYTFEVQHKYGFPTACSLIVSDEKGMLFAGVTDWSLGAKVMAGPSGFDLVAGSADCGSRQHNNCYESVTNTPLSVSHDGETVTLFHGESRSLSIYDVTCLTSQSVEYTSECFDAGLIGVSYVIERVTQ
jgi:hypothetical protein